MALPPKSDLPGASPAQAGENLGIEAFHAVDRTGLSEKWVLLPSSAQVRSIW